jgi:ATP:corrinoid adenosyltransferase
LLTRNHAALEAVEMANLVTEMHKMKYPNQRDLKVKQGIESSGDYASGASARRP